MKCINCGCDNSENFRFCQKCGSALSFNQNTLPERMRCLLKDDLFMLLCILYSVSVGFSLFSGGIPVIGVIMIIFLWLLFAESRKGIFVSNYIRNISGTVFASYIVNWVLCCFAALCGVLCIILFLFLDMTKILEMFYSEIESYIGDYLGIFSFFTNSYLLLLLAMLIIKAIIGILFNVWGRRSIHLFVQSIYKSLESGQINLARCKTAQIWMVVFGITDAISAAYDLARGRIFSFLAGGCLSAVVIMSSILTDRYFGDLK